MKVLPVKSYQQAQASHGLIHVEEGLDEVDADYLGYRIRHTMYSRISCIELDICCLLGILRIVFNSDGKNEIVLKFNTASYRTDFEVLINTVRKKMIETEHK